MSAKAGRSLPFEGMNEQALFMHCEVDTRVVDYRAQPFRFEFVVDGARRVYITDCARLLESGRIEIIEVKNDRRALKDPDYALKLACVRDICGRLGWSFRVVVKQQLFEPTNLYANVVEIQSRRRVRFDRSHVLPALDIIRRAGGQVPLGSCARTSSIEPRSSVSATTLFHSGEPIVEVGTSLIAFSTSERRTLNLSISSVMSDAFSTPPEHKYLSPLVE